MLLEFYFKVIRKLWEKLCGGMASVVGKWKDFPAKAHGISQDNTRDGISTIFKKSKLVLFYEMQN